MNNTTNNYVILNSERELQRKAKRLLRLHTNKIITLDNVTLIKLYNTIAIVNDNVNLLSNERKVFVKSL